MNYTKLSFEELVKTIDDASCELYERIKNKDSRNDKIFHNVWANMSEIEKMEKK